MSLTMPSMDLKGDQARIKKIELNEFTVRGGILSYKSITIRYKYNFDYYNILSQFFRSFPHGGSFTLYNSPWTILILHLFIIWALTWVLVPLDSLFGFLWVVVVKAGLFSGLLHINVTRKVAAMYSMRWWQFFLRYFWVPLLLICSWCKSLPLELLRRSP